MRFAFIFLGIFILLWLPVEEHSLVLILLIAGAASVLGLLSVQSLQKHRLPSEQIAKRHLRYPLAGMLAGAALTLVVLVLMAVKTGLHGHGAPDYSPAQVSLVLQLSPVWICLGLIAGWLAAVRQR